MVDLRQDTASSCGTIACMTPWGELHLKLLKARGYQSVRAFAEAVEYSHGNMSRSMRGAEVNGRVSTPPLNHIHAWADKLRLDDHERQRYVYLAHLEHTPQPVRDRIARLELTAVTLEQRLHQAQQRIADLERIVLSSSERVAEPPSGWQLRPDDPDGPAGDPDRQ